MSIAVARVEESRYQYRIAGISHPTELLARIGVMSSLIQIGQLFPFGALIPLLDGENIFLDNIKSGSHSIISGRSSLKGGVLLRSPAMFEVGVNEYFTGEGLLLVGFLTLQDLSDHKDLIPHVVGDNVIRGIW